MIKKIGAFIGRFFADQWNSYLPMGQLLFILAAIAMIIDAGISYQYGASATAWHAWGCAMVAIGCAIFPELSVSEFVKKSWFGGGFFAVIAALFLLTGLQNHLAYSGSLRVGDINKVSVQKAVHTDGRSSITDEEKKKDKLEARAKELDGEMNKMVATKVNGWSVIAKPSSPEELDEAISAKQLALDNEAKRVKCGRKCEDRKNELAHLKALRAKAAEIAKNDEEYTKTITTLAGLRSTSAEQKIDNSLINNQTELNGQLYKLLFTSASSEDAIKPDKVVMTVANILVTGGLSLAFMLMAPAFYVGAGRYRKPMSIRQDHNHALGADDIHLATAQNQQSMHTDRFNVVEINDNESRQALAALRRLIEQRHVAA